MATIRIDPPVFIDDHWMPDKSAWIENVLKQIKDNGKTTIQRAGVTEDSAADVNEHAVENDIQNMFFWNLTIQVDQFPPEAIAYYQELQNAIAKEIPQEYNRPTIHVKIRGKNSVNTSKVDYVYIGGIGPLADAFAIGGILDEYGKLKKDETEPLANFCADLYSSPPGRPDDPNESEHNKRFIRKMAELVAKTPTQNYGMLSNTAHLNIGKFSALMALRGGFPAVENLVDKMVLEITSKEGWEGKGAVQKVLVCGTSVAADGELYQQKFNRKANFVMPEGKMQLQDLIDLIKAGNTNKTLNEILKDAKAEGPLLESNKTVGEMFIDFLISEVRRAASVPGQGEFLPSHIMLSCTELPLCFHTEIDKAKVAINDDNILTYEQLFYAKCKEINPNYKPTVIDTEHGMAKNIAQTQVRNESARLSPSLGRRLSNVIQQAIPSSRRQSSAPSPRASLIIVPSPSASLSPPSPTASILPPSPTASLVMSASTLQATFTPSPAVTLAAPTYEYIPTKLSDELIEEFKRLGIDADFLSEAELPPRTAAIEDESLSNIVAEHAAAAQASHPVQQQAAATTSDMRPAGFHVAFDPSKGKQSVSKEIKPAPASVAAPDPSKSGTSTKYK